MNKGGLGSDMGSMLERREKKKSQKSEFASEKINAILLEELHDKIKNQPRISFWDPESKIVLNYLKETKPKFSISKEISRVLQEYLEKEYPEIWTEVKQLRNE
ncbi:MULTISPECIES: hypothetical protein [Methanobacterium]|uniref:Uncharacterized protein n=1 Tax=Methanobacterium bryantii TaxID=2161 RepID=A0A2A2H8G1_METBR|nr:MULTISPECIES: hypothetical protein [Methanobacterium]OEC86218.1 hypothetical protein A9507_11360 [Methanobacterium sp. A39]PAV05667.1 hypothetical protein ASJ80_08000 [Methanobacterium bryantii]